MKFCYKEKHLPYYAILGFVISAGLSVGKVEFDEWHMKHKSEAKNISDIVNFDETKLPTPTICFEKLGKMYEVRPCKKADLIATLI